MMKTVTIAALLFTAAPAQAEAPLAPSGKWVVEYAANLCVLSRDYSTATKKMTFGIRPWPMGDSVEIVLIQPGAYGAGIQQGKAKVSLGPTAKPIAGTYNAYFADKTKVRVATIDIPHAAMLPLADATSIDIAMDGKAPVSFELRHMKSALSALSTCTDDLLRSWHIDPAEQLRIATPPKPISDVSNWIGSDDYPSDSLSRESGGAVSIIWTIDTDGKVKNCSVAATSGDPALDAAACAAISKHGRYQPALDKDGKALAVHSTRRIIWQLP